ncbi:MAG: hypothetical protein ACPIG7_00865, partial [Akkermansiaceae bacterium]
VTSRTESLRMTSWISWPRNLPPQVRSETQREREEVAVVTKILVLGVIVLVGLLAAAYYANQAFNS